MPDPLKRIMTAMKAEIGKQSRGVRFIVTLVVILAVLVGASGYAIYHRYQAAYRLGVERQLESIADLKINQIKEWRRERASDASGMYLNNIIHSRIIMRLKGDRSPELAREIQTLLNNFGHRHGYMNHYIVKPDSTVDMSSSPAGSPLNHVVREYILQNPGRPESEHVRFIDFYRTRPGRTINLDVLTPVLDTQGNGRSLLGYIVLEIDPKQYLYPLIQTWPTSSRTAETLLVRREGNEVVYLNELRHRKGTALTLRLPAAAPELPAARAVRGETGMVEGKDYRGVAVVAMIKKVPDSPWYIISKIDREEIYSPIRDAARIIALITSLTFLAFSGAVMSFWMKWQAGQYRYQASLEAQRAALSMRLENLMQNANDAIIISGKDHGIKEVNKRAGEMYGYTRDELLGMSLRDLRPPETKNGFDHDVEMADEGDRFMYETFHKRHDGTVFPVEISLNAIEIGGVRYYQSIIRDISERRRSERILRESREDLKRAQEVAHTGSWRLNVRLNELLWSDETYRVFGIPKGTPMTYEIFLGTIHPDDREYVDRKWKAAMHGEKYDIDHRILVGDTVKWVRERAELEFDPDGNLCGGFGTVQDITEKKQAEEEIRRFNTELEQLVSERTVRLEIANRELESFSYSVSHDLRAPLRAIEGFTRILTEEYGGSLDEEGMRIASVIVDNTKNMSRLIDDLLAFSRVGRYELRCAPVDMGSMVRSVFSEIVSPEDAQRITFVVHPMPDVHADASLIRQVWANLISNAVKFTSKKENPVIEVGGGMGNNDSAVYNIKDNGVGFDMAHAGKLFGVFQRLHSTKEFPGTGIGLALIQRIVLRHGGRVWAEGTPEHGASFYFSLPCNGPDSSAGQGDKGIGT